jgi:hypothetical protein
MALSAIHRNAFRELNNTQSAKTVEKRIHIIRNVFIKKA